jgi:hypothetical protein
LVIKNQIESKKANGQKNSKAQERHFRGFEVCPHEAARVPQDFVPFCVLYGAIGHNRAAK